MSRLSRVFGAVAGAIGIGGIGGIVANEATRTEPTAPASPDRGQTTTWAGYQMDRIRAGRGDSAASIRVLTSPHNNDPSADIISNLRNNDAIKNDPNALRALEGVSGDRQFRDALNLAIRNDPTVAQGLVDAARGNCARDANGNQLDIRAMVIGLGDQRARGVMTDVLRVVGRPTPPGEEDKFTMTYVQRVATAAQGLNEPNISEAEKRRRYQQFGTLLGEAGINNTGINVMAAGGPMAMLGQLFNDPRGFFNNLPNLLGLQGAQADAVRQIGGLVGGYIELVVGGQGGYRDFFNHYGPRMASGAMGLAQPFLQPEGQQSQPGARTADITSAGATRLAGTPDLGAQFRGSASPLPGDRDAQTAAAELDAIVRTQPARAPAMAGGP